MKVNMNHGMREKYKRDSKIRKRRKRRKEITERNRSNRERICVWETEGGEEREKSTIMAATRKSTILLQVI